MISQQTIDRILDVASIVDVIGSFVTLKRHGSNYTACCPFHDEKTPSFHVSPQKGIYKCFGCGKAGNAVGFIMEHERLTFPEAIKWLGKKYGIEVEDTAQSPEDTVRRNDRESMMAVTSFANEFFVNQLNNTDEGKSIGLSYFKERGFTKPVVNRFQLGYSPQQRDAFTQAALKAGYREEFLLKTGLTIKRDDGTLFDRFAGRVMFPIHSLSGRVIAFGGRTLRTDKKVAKYLNSPESDIYLKRNTLYGISFSKNSITRLDKCYLVEGYTDMLSMYAAGVENTVASSGTSLTDEQIKLISRFTKNITVLYDGDAAGIKASLRGIDMLLRGGLNVKVVLLPDGEDPDSFARKHSAEELVDFLANNERDFLKFKVGLLSDGINDPLKKAEVIHEIVNSISVIPDLITRNVYIRECSKVLDIDEETLTVEVARKRNKTLTAQSDAVEPDTRNVAATTDTDTPELPPKTPAIPAFVSNIYCQEQEKELLMYMLKYGKEELFRTTDDEGNEINIRVDEYIIQDIKNDDLEFQNLQYKKLFEEYERFMSLADTPDDSSVVTRLTRHEDATVSSMTVSLMMDTQMPDNGNYIVSKIWNGTDKVPIDLPHAIPKSLAAYKSKILNIAYHQLTTQLETADDNLDILGKIKLLIEQRKIIANILNRTVL
jgi:DNA primase